MGKFQDGVRAQADKARARLDYVHRGAMLVALASVVPGTPADTGRARGNWQVTFDAPAEGAIDRLDKPGNVTVQDGAGRIDAEASVLGRTIYLVNNVPYIRRLEEGHSKQGSRMVMAVVEAWPQIVEDLANEAKGAIP